MKINCQQHILITALNIVSKAVTSRATIPILKGFLLEASPDGILKLVASDLDLCIEKKIPVTVIEEGSIVVSAKLFNEIIRKLPNETIEIETDETSMTIKCMASEFSIVGQPADEFPSIGHVNMDNKIKIDSESFRNLIKKTSFSASIEEAKGIIVGVLIELEEDSINMAALDGFRMAVTKQAMTDLENKKIIVAGRILNEIYKILSDMDEEKNIELILEDKKAVILLEDTIIVLRLMEGEFIRYKDIIPKEYQCRLIVNRGELYESIERASLFSNDGKNNLIKLSVFRDKILITSRSNEGNVKEELFVEKEGNDLDIGFNAKYLLDVLKVLNDEEIVMEFNTPVSPCIIKPLEGDSYLYLVLPVRISPNS